MMRGTEVAMIVRVAGCWRKATLSSRSRNPVYRTLFNMACLVITVQAAGQVYQRLGGRPSADLSTIEGLVPLAGMAPPYFTFKPVPIATATALPPNPSARHGWNTHLP